MTGRLRSAAGSEHASVVDVSAQRTTLLLGGPRVRDLLALGCAVDLHPRSFAGGDCVQTLLALTGVTILVRDDAASDFLVLVRASFAGYLAAWLTDAAQDPSR